MGTIVRNDSIKLHAGVKEEDFERFVIEEMIPFFSKKYAGPTMKTAAFLISQSLLKDAKGNHNYLWTTRWNGPAECVQGSSFERALVADESSAETGGMLMKLESFGKRSPEAVFIE